MRNYVKSAETYCGAGRTDPADPLCIRTEIPLFLSVVYSSLRGAAGGAVFHCFYRSPWLHKLSSPCVVPFTCTCACACMHDADDSNLHVVPRHVRVCVAEVVRRHVESRKFPVMVRTLQRHVARYKRGAGEQARPRSLLSDCEPFQ